MILLQLEAKTCTNQQQLISAEHNSSKTSINQVLLIMRELTAVDSRSKTAADSYSKFVRELIAVDSRSKTVADSYSKFYARIDRS